MNRFLFSLALMALSSQSNAGMSADVVFEMADSYHNQVETGGEMTPVSGMFTGYVIGIATVLNSQGRICIPSEVSNRTLISQVYDYMHANQKLKKLPEGSFPVMLALSEYYKCK